MSKLDIFKDPKFWAIHVGSPHHISPRDYNQLISETEFHSFSYNYNSRALWKKKVLSPQ